MCGLGHVLRSSLVELGLGARVRPHIKAYFGLSMIDSRLGSQVLSRSLGD